ncbi:MAG: NirD/YgiW/YdeI family stress tolerance protein [Treponema sp.]|nr:NirD/YgiW/YdeI family stress tolerance protein [Treponema sp.]
MRRLILSLLFLLPAAFLYGQGFVGSGNDALTIMNSRFISVTQARSLPQDSWVALNGNIINMLPGGSQYTFRDATGDIPVDIGPKEWRGLSVDASDRVEIYGEVKINRGQMHIKVRAISGTGRVIRLPGQPVTVTQTASVLEAVSLPHDSFVVLSGNIISSLQQKNRYLFRDSAGDIVLEIGNKEWRGNFVNVYNRVEIYGEVKINRGITHIKVHAVRITGA